MKNKKLRYLAERCRCKMCGGHTYLNDLSDNTDWGWLCDECIEEYRALIKSREEKGLCFKCGINPLQPNHMWKFCISCSNSNGE